jgi:hypothetical protein
LDVCNGFPISYFYWFKFDILGIFLGDLFFTKNKTATIVITGILLVIWVVSRQDTSGSNLFVWIVFVITLLPVIFFFNRFGIVTFFSWSFFGNFIDAFPKTFDPNNILFAPTVTALAIVFGTMAYAAYVSIGEAKMFGEKSFWSD